MTDLPKLSVLDLATVSDGSTPADALRNSLELAQHAERLGYHRHWVAEHHNMPGIASSAPAVLIAEIASATETMRVGSGGVMLPNHAPLVVAEQFGMLDALHPGRIDLGIGRAPGTDGVTAMALRRDANPLSDDDFPQALGELVAFFEGKFPDGHPYGSITAVPGEGNLPEIWLLGSSGYSAQVAGMLGWPFSFAHHFMARNTLPALELYRKTFRPPPGSRSPRRWSPSPSSAPRTTRRPATSRARRASRWRGFAPATRRASRRTRRQRPTSSRRKDEAKIADLSGSAIVGGPETVKRRLEELAEETQADELMITTMVYDHADRLRSYELVAEIAGHRRHRG